MSDLRQPQLGKNVKNWKEMTQLEMWDTFLWLHAWGMAASTSNVGKHNQNPDSSVLGPVRGKAVQLARGSVGVQAPPPLRTPAICGGLVESLSRGGWQARAWGGGGGEDLAQVSSSSSQRAWSWRPTCLERSVDRRRGRSSKTTGRL